MNHPILEYLGKSSAVLLVWCVLYRLLLRRQTFFQLSRAFLLAVIVWLGALPLVRIPLYYPAPSVAAAAAVLPAVAVVAPSGGATPAADTPFDWTTGLLYAYVFGVAVCLLRLGWQMFRLWRFRCFFPNRTADGYRLVDTTGSGLPVFSFFNWLFWQENPAWTPTERRHVLAHELAHIRQRHSVDALLMEVMAAAFWFHPAAHLLKADLKTVHEYLADQAAMRQGNAQIYMRLVQRQLLQRLGLHPPLAQPFCSSQIKQRIAMLKTPDSSATKRLRYVWVVAAVLLLAGLLACEKVPQKTGAVVVPAGKFAVTGQVTDENGKPIARVTVMLKGTTKGAVADEDGRYVLLLDEMPRGDEMLVFSHVAYRSTETPVAGRTAVDVDMEPSVQALSRIYIFGYTNDPVEPLMSAIEMYKDSKETPLYPLSGDTQARPALPPGAFLTVE